MNRSCVTIAEALKPAGYRSYAVGKWHVTPGQTAPAQADTHNWPLHTPFREYKHWTHEGGISTPLIAHWPKGIPASRRNKLEPQPGHVIDIMATCLDVAGAKYPGEHDRQKIKPMEGASLHPAFAGNSVHRAQPIFWEHEGNRAVRDGQWKLVGKENQPWELYDMKQDRTELHDRASAEPTKAKELAAKWDAYAARANVLPLSGWRGKNADTK